MFASPISSCTDSLAHRPPRFCARSVAGIPFFQVHIWLPEIVDDPPRTPELTYRYWDGGADAGKRLSRQLVAHGRRTTATQCPTVRSSRSSTSAGCRWTTRRQSGGSTWTPSDSAIRDPAEREGESRRPWRLEIPEHEDIRSVTSLVPLAARSAQLPTDGEINAVGKTSVTAPRSQRSRAVRGGTAFKRQSQTWLYRGPLRGLRIPVAVLREPRCRRGFRRPWRPVFREPATRPSTVRRAVATATRRGRGCVQPRPCPCVEGVAPQGGSTGPARGRPLLWPPRGATDGPTDRRGPSRSWRSGPPLEPKSGCGRGSGSKRWPGPDDAPVLGGSRRAALIRRAP